MISTIGKSCQSTGNPLHAPKLGELCLETAENSPFPIILALRDNASLTAWTLYSRQQANIGTFYVVARAYSLERQAGLCHASTCYFRPTRTTPHAWKLKLRNTQMITTALSFGDYSVMSFVVGNLAYNRMKMIRNYT